MKNSILATLVLLSTSAFAGGKTTLTLEQAVIGNAEIKSVLKAIASARNLKCEKPDPSDVKFKKVIASSGIDFELTYGCNDKNGGANVHRITVSGYLINQTSAAPQAFALDYQIQQSE